MYNFLFFVDVLESSQQLHSDDAEDILGYLFRDSQNLGQTARIHVLKSDRNIPRAKKCTIWTDYVLVIALKQGPQLQNDTLCDFWVVTDVNFFQSESLLAWKMLGFPHLTLRTAPKLSYNHNVW